MRSFAITTAVLAVLAAGFVIAQEGRGRFRSPAVTALDADGDGIISQAEILNAPAALLKLDKNGDGALTEDEVRPNFEGRGGRGGRGRGDEPGETSPPSADDLRQTLMAFDKNGDGKISRDEMPERMRGMFDRGDTNKDGFLTADEIQKMAMAQAAPPADERRGEGRGQGRGEGRGRGGMMRMDPVLAALDADHDGTISAAEIANAPAALRTLDRNGDGRLTEDELRPAGGRGGFDRGGGGDPDEMAARIFERFDRNGDGKLSRDEMSDGPLGEMFDRADANKDGAVTLDELKAAIRAGGFGRGGRERQ